MSNDQDVTRSSWGLSKASSWNDDQMRAISSRDEAKAAMTAAGIPIRPVWVDDAAKAAEAEKLSEELLAADAQESIAEGLAGR